MIAELSEENTFTRFEFRNFEKIIIVVFYSHKFPPSVNYVDLVQKLEHAIQPSPVFVWAYANIDQYPSAIDEFKVSYNNLKYCKLKKLPSVLISSNPKALKDEIVTLSPTALFDYLPTLVEAFQSGFQKEKEVYMDKCKRMVESNPFVIFIKGTPEQPKCKFTRQLLGELKQFNIKFRFYDIDNDKPMRHWLKYYSNWKTFPQIFIDGKLLGGLDVCLDLIKKGQFTSRIPKASIVEQINSLHAVQQLHPNLILHYDQPDFNHPMAKSLKAKGIEFQFYNVALDNQLLVQLENYTLGGQVLLLRGEQLYNIQQVQDIVQ